MLSQLGGWEIALLIASAFLAVTLLARRMGAYQNNLITDVRRQIDEARKRRDDAATKQKQNDARLQREREEAGRETERMKRREARRQAEGVQASLETTDTSQMAVETTASGRE